MKKIVVMATMLVCVLAGCQGVSNDGKDKNDRPTYDTTDEMNQINSSGTNKDSVRTGGDGPLKE